ncbi:MULTISPECIES: hypothetical protein [Comamonas]|uniref:hypothetical protein n=1 Tax=Comamonas TaxID=283 RepID=UPI000AB746DB|nr:hypothetical protein [Comamonas terrigena]BBL24735.1 hypothetical protein CT3_21900 [Comamonas terrigena NBRC 13299]SUY71673.1 Uncharacterised protein [Comamonas terrigena]
MSETKTKPVVIGPAQALLVKESRWEHAGPEERAVLQRIAQQRDRLAARKATYQQVAALRAQASAVSPDAPLIDRVLTFARLHPLASAALVGAALLVGPRKIMRVGVAVLPLLAKLRR